jgi:hypothetical protein
MELPPEIEADIVRKQQRAWDSGLIQSLSWLVNEIIRPRLADGHTSATFPFSLNEKDYLVHFEGNESRSFLHEHGEYEGRALLFEEGYLRFQLAFAGYSESSPPPWATRGPSAQSAVEALIEGPWIEPFLGFVTRLKEEKRTEAEKFERMRQVADKESIEEIKRRFGLT